MATTDFVEWTKQDKPHFACAAQSKKKKKKVFQASNNELINAVYCYPLNLIKIAQHNNSLICLFIELMHQSILHNVGIACNAIN